jgi:pilus assembly protein Flp/PilA
LARELQRGNGPANVGDHHREEINVNDTILKLYIKMQDLLSRDEGQDLVEYALVTAIISLGAVTMLKGVATAVVTIFTNIGTTLNAAPTGS